MTKLRGKALSSLYPKPRPKETIEAERKTRALTRQPQFIAAKISALSTIIFSASLLAYVLVYTIMQNSLSSIGGVFAGISFSVLVLLFAIILMLYCYASIEAISSKVFGTSGKVFAVLIAVSFFCGAGLTLLAQHHHYDRLSVAIVLALDLSVSYIAINYIHRHTKFIR